MSNDIVTPEGMPKLTAENLKTAAKRFENFLFFKCVKPGVRDCRCTACGKNFICGTNVIQRISTPEIRKLEYIKHLEYAVCPFCGEKVMAISVNKQLSKNNPTIELLAPTAFFYGKKKDEVWIACYFVNRTISVDGKNIRDTADIKAVYKLTPHTADCWKHNWCYGWGWNSGLFYSTEFKEPFKWDSGLSHYDFDYCIVSGDGSLYNDTFLKWSGYTEYMNKYRNSKHTAIRFWFKYCRFNQIEMLSKLGRFETVETLLYKDGNFKRTFNFEAKKPWEFYKLNKEEYKEWIRLGADITLLKVYRRLKQENIKNFIIAKWLLEKEYNRLGETYKLIALLNKYKVNGFFLKKYCERISRNSAGACHCCPGITTQQAFNTWMDYVFMGDDGNKNFNPFPSNLKAAHDALIKRKQIKKMAEAKEEYKKEAKTTAKKLRTTYPNVDKICEKISTKYEFDNGEFAFIIPKGIEEILFDGLSLSQCTARPDGTGKYWRYFDRINRNESYIGFVRYSKSKTEPYFTIEFEPGGTVRQKRGYGDNQPEPDTSVVTSFLVEWQKVIVDRLSIRDKKAAKRSKTIRLEEFSELRKTKKKINYGTLAGTLLIDAFEKDLMEIELEAI